MKFTIYEDETRKCLRSEAYNFNFNKDTGFFARWGETEDDDPPFSPFGPEILDLEISVNGCPNNCKFCYKGNSNEPATNMSLETFKQILDKMPPTLMQIAFGISGAQTNPDFVAMMQYTREKGVIPNFTLTGIDLTDELAAEIAPLVGGLAVSVYQTNKNIGYDTIKKFLDLGVKQTNTHLLVSQETLPFVYEVLDDRLNDPRLADMNAIIFLGVKPKGRAEGQYHPVSVEEYTALIKHCMDAGIMFGFDSCSAPKFEQSLEHLDLSDEYKERLIMCSESCESSLFSSYINVDGIYTHCSFAEGETEGVNVLEAENFSRDVWHSPRVVEFRNKSMATEIDGCRRCTVFPEINDD